MGRIGRYDLEGVLGVGAFATVHVATDPQGIAWPSRSWPTTMV